MKDLRNLLTALARTAAPSAVRNVGAALATREAALRSASDALAAKERADAERLHLLRSALDELSGEIDAVAASRAALPKMGWREHKLRGADPMPAFGPAGPEALRRVVAVMRAHEMAFAKADLFGGATMKQWVKDTVHVFTSPETSMWRHLRRGLAAAKQAEPAKAKPEGHVASADEILKAGAKARGEASREDQPPTSAATLFDLAARRRRGEIP